MEFDEARERSERLLLGVATAVIDGEDGVVSTAPPKDGFLARAAFTSRQDPTRVVAVNLGDEWLEAVFVVERNVGIFMMVDFQDETYTTERLRELLVVVRAYLRGEGSVEWRRTLFGERRPRLGIQAGGREWVARRPVFDSGG